jgi:hypothetical protein
MRKSSAESPCHPETIGAGNSISRAIIGCVGRCGGGAVERRLRCTPTSSEIEPCVCRLVEIRRVILRNRCLDCKRVMRQPKGGASVREVLARQMEVVILARHYQQKQINLRASSKKYFTFLIFPELR